jgi:predicted aspartyl protease
MVQNLLSPESLPNMPMLSCLVAAGLLASSPASQAPIEVPFRVGEDAIIVDATVNNRKVSLMFDTGFSGSVIVNNTINLGKPVGTINLRDFVGQFEAPVVELTSMSLGSKKIDTKGMRAVQKPTTDYSFAYNTHVDGIMGFEVIKDYITEINFERGRFIFHPPSTDITKRTPDNKRTFLARLLPIGTNSLEMAVRTANGERMTLALDTGNAFYATTHRDVLERIGVWPKGRQPQYTKLSGVASGPVDSWDIQLRDLDIYGVPVASSVWNIIDLPSSSAEGDGTVGYGFLKNFNIIIDYGRRRVWLENFTGKVAEEPLGDVGISAFMDPRQKRVVIFGVSPGSPADKAGVKEQDHLLSIDGQELLDIGWRRLRAMLEGPAGSKVKLAVSRRGELMRFELERAHLFNRLD